MGSEFGIATTDHIGDCERCDQQGGSALRIIMWNDVERRRLFLCEPCFKILCQRCEAALALASALVDLGRDEADALDDVAAMIDRPPD